MKSRAARLVSIFAFVVLTFPVRLVAQGGYIYNYAGNGRVVTDITGSPAQISLFFENKGANSQSDHPLPITMLPQNAQQFLTTPLNRIFDQLWSGALDANGKTMRDRATDKAIAQIQKAAKKKGYDASNISGSIPATGSMRAIALRANPSGLAGARGPTLILSYWLQGADFTFNTGVADVATWRVTFDAELMIIIDFEYWGVFPNWLSPRATATAADANISAANVAAAAAEAWDSFTSFISDEPIAVFQAAEGSVDSTGTQPPDLGQLTSLLNSVSSVAVQAGFLSCVPIVDPNSRTAKLQLVHPIDPAPVLVSDSTLAGHSFLHPMLATGQSQVRAGAQFTAYGSYFPANLDTQIGLNWNDATTGRPLSSDIMWGINGQTQPTISVSRQASQNAIYNNNRYVATNLSPGANYQFQVRECDMFTCTGWSNLLNITSQPTNRVDLLLDYPSKDTPGLSHVVGSATLGASSFSSTITVPAEVPPGVHRLWAQLAGTNVAETSITVLAPNQNLQPTLQVIDPATNVVWQNPGIQETYPFTLRGENFAPGRYLFYIDNTSGQELGVIFVGANGKFTATLKWPRGVYGIHSVIAYDQFRRRTEASVSLNASKLPT